MQRAPLSPLGPAFSNDRPDPDRPLAEYGMDSLGALELRTRIETETGIRINPSDMTITVRGLAELLCEKLAQQKPADSEVST